MPAVDTANEIILARGMRTLRGGFEAFGKIKQGGWKSWDSIQIYKDEDSSLDAAAAVPTHERTIG